MVDVFSPANKRYWVPGELQSVQHSYEHGSNGLEQVFCCINFHKPLTPLYVAATHRKQMPFRPNIVIKSLLSLLTCPTQAPDTRFFQNMFSVNCPCRMGNSLSPSRYIEWCMEPSGELFMCSRQVFVCLSEINTKITLGWGINSSSQQYIHYSISYTT